MNGFFGKIIKISYFLAESYKSIQEALEMATKQTSSSEVIYWQVCLLCSTVIIIIYRNPSLG